MRSILRPGDVAIDVGAYKGGYTYWMRHSVGESGLVVCFEPQPSLAAYLRRCVRAFGWTNVGVEELALSSTEGGGMLYVPNGKPSPGASLVGASLPSGSQGYPVRTGTLDRALESQPRNAPVRLIKCDVEGHELDVFLGARQTLETDRPFILFECEARHLAKGCMADVFGHLQSLGYSGSFFWGRERIDVSAFDVDRHQVQGRRPYGNNFVFTPDEAPAPE